MRSYGWIGLFLVTLSARLQEPTVAAQNTDRTKPHLKVAPPSEYLACKPLPEQPVKILIGFKVGATGHPENAAVELSSGNHCLDEAATQAVATFSYDPVTQNGVSVAADAAVEFTFSSKDHHPYALVAPVESIGKDISPPVVLKSAVPHFPRSFFHPHYPGEKAVVLVALTVDTDGLPQNVHVIQTPSERWNKSAIEAVKQYRFKPASKAGGPVPVEMHVEVTYEVK